jgi:ketosteroid isomerase-like protein
MIGSFPVRDTPPVGENAELVRDVFRDFNRSGIDSVLGLLHPQIEVIDLPQVPEERRRRGREAVAAWFHSLEDVWARLRVDAEEVTELDAERVLAAVRFSGHARGSGMDVEQRVAIVCTIRDGKAVRWQIYPSRDEATADR